MIKDYRHLLGTPYLVNGRQPKIGMDCSGVLEQVLLMEGRDIPMGAIPTRDSHPTVQWERIGDSPWCATKIGDAIVGYTRKATMHIWTFIGEDKVLTAALCTGTSIIRMGRIQSKLEGVYRLK